MDQNNDKRLDLAEFMNTLKAFDKNVTNEEIEYMFSNIDSEGKGYIT